MESRCLLAVWIPQGPAPVLHGQITNVVPDNQVVGAIQTAVAHPTDADTLWVGAVNGGIWRTDNATSANPDWTPQSDDQASLSIGALELDLTDPNHDTLVAGIGRFSSFGRDGGSLTGILHTTDGGATWTNPGSVGLVGENISGVAARGADMLAASNGTVSGFGGIFRSSDGGATFTRITNGLPGGTPDVFDLVIDPNTPLRVYASVEDTGIYRSDDFGLSWSNISSGDPTLDSIIGDSRNNNTEMAVADNGRLYAAVLLDDQAAYIGFVDNPAAATPTWTAMDLPQTLEAGGEVEGLNPEEEEQAGGHGSIHFSIRVDPSNPDIIYAGGDAQPGPFPNYVGAHNFSGRLFRGDASVIPTGGVPSPQWEHLTDSNAVAGIPGGGTASSSGPHADSREIVFDANGDLIETNDGGIYRRTSPRDNTGDWFSINGDLQVSEQHDVAYDSLSNIIISGTQDAGTQQQLTSGGLVWDTVAFGDGGDVVVDDSGPTSYRYYSSQNLGRFRRAEYDAANNWVFLPTSLAGIPDAPFVTPLQINAVDSTRLLIAGSSNVHESLDRGASNTPVLDSTGANEDSLAYGHVTNPDLIVAGDSSTVLVRSGPVGSAMTPTASPFPGGNIEGLVIDPTVADVYYVIDNSHVYQTIDGGASWTNITGNLSSLAGSLRSVEYVEAFPNDGLLVGTNNGVFFARSNDFTEWIPLGTGLPNAPAYELDYDPADDVLLAGTLGRGAWLIEDVTIEINGSDNPEFLANDFQRLDPTGSLVSASTGNGGKISFVDDVDDFTFFAEEGTTIAAIVRPDSPGDTLSAEFVGLGPAVVAAVPGEAVVLAPAAVLADGIERIRIGGDEGASYTVELIRNAALEALVGDSDDVGGELAIDDALIELGSGRTAVLGHAAAGDVDAYTFDFSSALGSRIDIVLAGQGEDDFSAELLELISPDGSTTVGTASPDPLGTPATNWDLGLLGVEVDEIGAYTVRLDSSVEGDYVLLVTQSLAFDTESNDDGDVLRNLDGFAGALGSLSPAQFGAGLDFQIDPLQSFLTLTGTIVNADGSIEIPLVEQTAGSLTTALGGMLPVAVGLDSLQFLGGSTLDSLAQAGPFDPGGAPADFALQAEIIPEVLLLFVAVRDTTFDVVSPPLVVDPAGQFAANSMVLSISGGTADVEVPNVIVDSFDLAGSVADNASLEPGILKRFPDHLELAFSTDVVFEAELGVSGLDLVAYVNVTGTIVARADIVQDLVDTYEVTLTAGQRIALSTSTPQDNVSGTPLNPLDPRLSIRDSDGVELAFDEDSGADGRNAALSFAAPVGGTYQIAVSTTAGAGEYLLEFEDMGAGINGRHIFYNQSFFDGNSAAANADDSAAIATDKVAYLPGDGLIGPESMTSYTRGINGIMVDLEGPHGTLTPDDFDFHVSTLGAANNMPSTWDEYAGAVTVNVLTDTPAAGTDRVELVFPHNAIQNRYLEVRVLGNDAAGGFNTNTGLADTDIFYFGNIIGDTFENTPAGGFATTSTDEAQIRAAGISAAAITSPYDIDRNGGQGLATDQAFSRANAITGFIRINISDPPTAPEAAAATAVADARSAVASALAAAGVVPDAASQVKVGMDPPRAAHEPHRAPLRRFLRQLADANQPRANTFAHASDWLIEALDLDDWLDWRAARRTV